MPRSALEKQMINAGLPERPLRTYAELLAEHKAMQALLRRLIAATSPADCARIACEAAALIQRCEA
jgi:hypothetical protein